jgi:hypothetical protein
MEDVKKIVNASYFLKESFLGIKNISMPLPFYIENVKIS